MLDDVDARPGSATSLVRTIVGAYVRALGGWIATADLVALLAQLGVAAPSARSAISRVRAKGLLDAETVGGRSGYRLAAAATPMLERGDRRIFGYRQQGEDDPWCLVSYTVPEDRRDARHQLRRQLTGIGCGRVAPGLWICPAHQADEVEDVLAALGLRAAATLFVAGPPRVEGSLADAVARWWDLDHVAALHRGFLAVHGDAAHAGDAHGGGTAPATAATFARWTRVLDAWRPVPYLDPGLPASLLPSGWPGRDGVRAFDTLRAALAVPAAAYVQRAVGDRRY
ncbi:PaaX family transcriptional regulator C-terminal domain-containing protein [Isoptericola sp. BMS4]|uniref:PaaX family transcriptional regulator n=1 Tax=Isoptericola sp. BMS4 TaxID=2527875 RepID=UPI00142327F7|nr:PaaX family transcriptional regulator C-terminal domain-containing protein [Isoptericola sp. BMS4]